MSRTAGAGAWWDAAPHYQCDADLRAVSIVSARVCAVTVTAQCCVYLLTTPLPVLDTIHLYCESLFYILVYFIKVVEIFIYY